LAIVWITRGSLASSSKTRRSSKIRANEDALADEGIGPDCLKEFVFGHRLRGVRRQAHQNSPSPSAQAERSFRCERRYSGQVFTSQEPNRKSPSTTDPHRLREPDYTSVSMNWFSQVTPSLIEAYEEPNGSLRTFQYAPSLWSCSQARQSQGERGWVKRTCRVGSGTPSPTRQFWFRQWKTSDLQIHCFGETPYDHQLSAGVIHAWGCLCPGFVIRSGQPFVLLPVSREPGPTPTPALSSPRPAHCQQRQLAFIARMLPETITGSQNRSVAGNSGVENISGNVTVNRDCSPARPSTCW
jgi:hypothetical protein